MEAAGLVVGIAGLAGIFGACMDIINKFESYENAESDSRRILNHFEADKIRLSKWGDAVGLFKKQQLNELNNPNTAKLVKNILFDVQLLFGKNDEIIQKLQIGPYENGDPPLLYAPALRSAQSSRKTGSISTREKLKWTLSRKESFTSQVYQFDICVQKLYQLVPLPGDNSIDFAFRESQSMLAEIVRQIREEKRRIVSRWLAPSITNALYDKSVRARLDGTCDWFRTRRAFADWISPDFPSQNAKFLWINAPAGFGKTILCARIVEEISETLEIPRAYHFFSSDSKDREDPFIVMRSWIVQLMAFEEVFDYVCGVYEDCSGEYATYTEITGVFREIIHRLPGCTLIVDGLDECSTVEVDSKFQMCGSREDFMRSVSQAVSDAPVRVLVSSRPEIDIGRTFDELSRDGRAVIFYKYEIIPDDVRPDNTLFAAHITSQRLHTKPKAVREEISQRMVERCNGMFLWLRFQGPELKGWKNKRQLEDTINKAPTRLQGVYDRNWSAISDLPLEDRERAYKILRWVVFATRPLTVAELAEASLIPNDNSDGRILFDDLPDEIDEEYINSGILEPCQSLVEVRKETKEQDWGSMRLHLAHFSIRQYILQNLSGSGLLLMNEQLRNSSEEFENNILANMCLTYLASPVVWNSPVSCRPFRRYAAEMWYRHVARNGSNYQDILRVISRFLLETEGCWEAWRNWFDSAKKPFETLAVERQSRSPLCYASNLGLADTVKTLVSGIGSTIENEDYQLAFLTACSEGHLQIAQALLTEQANLVIEDDTLHRSLHAATARGHLGIVELLLERGVKTTVSDTEGETPLILAAKNGHLDVLQSLLRNGADVQAEDKKGWTALHFAVENGFVEIVRLLLKQNAVLTTSPRKSWTPLLIAAGRGDLAVVEILLEAGSQLSEEDKASLIAYNGLRIVTPLHVAASHNNLRIVEILVHFIDEHLNKQFIDAKNRYGKTALHDAAERGFLQIVDLLLLHGADLEAKDNNKWTPLAWASDNNRLEIVQSLLNRGAHISTTDNEGWTPLIAACSQGHLQIARVLLENGADISESNMNGWTPLISASNGRHEEVIRFLLESDVNSSAGHFATALNEASFLGLRRVVHMLLQKNADVSETGKLAKALLLAVHQGYEEIVRLLLAHGADVNMTCEPGGAPFSFSHYVAPLHLAAAKGYKEITELLLNYGADVNMPLGPYLDDATLLHGTASVVQEENVPSLLIKRVVNVNKGSRSHITAVHVAMQRNHTDIVHLMLRSGQSFGNDSLHAVIRYAILKGNLDIVQSVLENGFDLHQHMTDYTSPLHLALHHGKGDIAVLLLRSGAPINCRCDRWRKTPLHMAAERGELSIVKLLLSGGSDANSLDDFHQPPLHYAAEKGYVDIVRCLVGVTDLSVVDVHGRTALRCAKASQNTEVIEIISSWGAT